MQLPQTGLLPQAAYRAKLVGLAATFTGSGNDTVADFTGGTMTNLGAIPIADWLVQTDSATLGTVFRFTRRGIYEVTASVTVQPSVTVLAAITLDAAGLNTDPHRTLTSTLDGGLVVAPGLTDATINLKAVIPQRQFDIEQGTVGAVRLQLSDNADGPPGANSILVAQVQMVFTRVADCP